MSDHWIQTHNGKAFDLVDPTPDDIDIEVIAFALSNIARFTGHCDFYSVAQHSVHVSDMVPYEYALQGLLHDAAEAYLGDVASPLKKLLPAYGVLEERVWRAIAVRFDVPFHLHESVKHADKVALMTERRDLFGFSAKTWAAELEAITPAEQLIEPLCPDRARDLFMQRFEVLTGVHAPKKRPRAGDPLRDAIRSLSGCIPADRIEDVARLAQAFVDALNPRGPAPSESEWRASIIESREIFDGADDGFAAADWVVSRAYRLAARTHGLSPTPA